MGICLLSAAIASMLPTPVPGLPGTGLTLEERWKALEATPRVIGATGGTGVVIGRRAGESVDELYVLTAEHVVRKEAQLKLEFFERATYPKVSRTVLYGGVVEDFPVPDFALLKFPVAKDQRFPQVNLATLGDRPRRFPASGLTIGCSGGQPPTWEAVTLTAKRLVRKANDQEIAFFWETAEPPTPGRSGGPIFDESGRLIGICSATTGGKGYYAYLDEILAGLKQRKLGWLVAEGRSK